MSGPELLLPLPQLLVHGLEGGLVLHQHRPVPVSPCTASGPWAAGGGLPTPSPALYLHKTEADVVIELLLMLFTVEEGDREGHQALGRREPKSQQGLSPAGLGSRRTQRFGGGEGWKVASVWHIPGLCQGQREGVPESHPKSLLCIDRTWRPRGGGGQGRAGEEISLRIVSPSLMTSQ